MTYLFALLSDYASCANRHSIPRYLRLILYESLQMMQSVCHGYFIEIQLTDDVTCSDDTFTIDPSTDFKVNNIKSFGLSNALLSGKSRQIIAYHKNIVNQ
jgi:hypothetical protein